MVEQIHLLSKEVIRLRGQLIVYPQPARDVPTHNLPPQPHRTPITRRRLSYVEGYGQNEKEPPKQRPHSLAWEHSHRPTVPLKSEHSHRVHISHCGREISHHSRCSMLDSSSSSDLHREKPWKRDEENSRHHQPDHQKQVEGSSLSKRVLETKVPNEYLSIKMNLDNYNGLTDPQEHI